MIEARAATAHRSAPEGARCANLTGAPHRCAVSFVVSLRAAGLDVPVDATVTYARALAAVGLASSRAAYWAGRATLVHRREDVAAYDAAFAAFWQGAPPAPPAQAPAPRQVVLAVDDSGETGDESDREDPNRAAAVALRYSDHEVLRHKDFARCTPEELDEVRRLLGAVRLGGAVRRTRRRRAARRGDSLDVRRTVRHGLRRGGDLVHLRRRARTVRPRRIVLLCDVSGSMAPYARALLQFAHAAVAGRRRVEAFTVGTRLTRVTRTLAGRDPDAALAATAEAVLDWSGGTRLGEAVRAFNDRWGVPGLARGAVVVILSDGWDQGDPDVLGTEMARLARVAHRVVWVNPLKATPGFQPLARGMAAAAPHVDDLVAGHSVASLEALATLVAGGGRSRTHEPRLVNRRAADLAGATGAGEVGAMGRPCAGGGS